MKEKLSYSTGKTLLHYEAFPEVAISRLEEPRPATKAMDLGNMLEKLLVGGTEAPAVYYGKRRAGPEWTAFVAANEGREILKASEIEGLLEEVAAINQTFPTLAGMSYQDHVEFEDRGVMVHGYTDFQCETLVFDLKRSDPDQRSFAKQIGDFYYPLQAYIYARATGKDFAWVVCSPDKPHPIRIYLPDEECMLIGAAMYELAHGLFLRYRAGELLTESKPSKISASRWLAHRYLSGDQE